MSFSNILSSNTVEPTKPLPKPAPPPKQPRRVSKVTNGDVAPPHVATPQSTSTRKTAQKLVLVKEELPLEMPKETPTPKGTPTPRSKPTKAQLAKKAASHTDKENERVLQAMAEIDAMEHSDLESPGWEGAKDKHLQMSRKRLLAVEESEQNKRKVCLVLMTDLSEC